MRKNHYKFIGLILILILLIYNIFTHKYQQYKIENYNKTILKINNEIKKNIEKAKNIIEYKQSTAYKNKILKQDKGLKNKGEKIVYITTEEKYNKYVSKNNIYDVIDKKRKNKLNNYTYGMTIYQKWVYFIFKKDLR